MVRRVIADAPIEDVAWDQAWLGCPYATFFHSRTWAEIWKTHTGGTVVPSGSKLILDDGTHVVLPLSVQTAYSGLVNIYLSSPGGTFGGWFAQTQLSGQQACGVWEHLRSEYPNMVLCTNPYDNSQAEVAAHCPRTDATEALDLAPGFDSIWNDWRKSGAAARNVKKAVKSGVQIRLAEGEKDWKEYFGIYQDTLRRWGDKATSNYGWAIFRELEKRSGGHIKLWLATRESGIIAGAICLYGPKHAVYWHGAALEEYFPLRPVNLLMCEMIRDACDRGFSWFDFNPSGGQEGVRAFKKSLGAVAKTFGVRVTRTIFAKSLERSRSGLNWIRRK